MEDTPNRKTSERPSITAFFPCYNDAGTIASIVFLTELTLRKLTDNYEIVVIDDASTDHSLVILRELESRLSRLRIIEHEKNRGYGAALRTGFSHATKELVFYTDGDFQYDVAELELLLAALTDNVDVVNGYKISRSDPLRRRILGEVYRHLTRLLFGLSIRDVDCDFRLLRRKVFDRVHLDRDSGSICVEIIKKIQDAGFRIIEVPVHHYSRPYGESQFFTVGRVFRVALDLITLWWRLVVKREHLQHA